MSLNDVYIISAARTPIGSFQGTLNKVSAQQLGITAVKGALQKANVDASKVEEVYFGNVLQAALGQSPARQVALGAGCPSSTEATTINKVCASGMKAISLAAQNIQTGQRDLMVAGGMESMSNSPFYFTRTPGFGHQKMTDSIVNDGLWDVYNNTHMGNCAEETAKKYQITREQQDEYALESYRRAAKAWETKAFDNEIIPVEIPDPRKGPATVIVEDEDYKKVKPEKVPTLKPAFQKEGGTVTAANASNINDGASAVVLASKAKVDELGLKPIAKIVAYADAARDPVDFTVAPALAMPRALEKAGLELKDMAKIEVNEAFSAVALANTKILGLDPAKTNVLGGGVALGHPIGSSGSRIVVTLAHLLQPGEYGLAGVCNGGGGASAMVIQRL